MTSTHFAVQISADIWLVTFVSELGLTETRRLSAAEFAAVVLAERDLG
jgi:hypothetical protein